MMWNGKREQKKEELILKKIEYALVVVKPRDSHYVLIIKFLH